MELQQKRLFLALLLSAAVVVGWQLFFVKPPPPPSPADTRVEEAGAEGSGSVPTVVSPPPVEGTGEGTALALPAEPTEPVPPSIATAPGIELVEPHSFQGRGFSAVFTNAGAILFDHHIEEPEQYVPREDFTGIFPQRDSQHRALGILVPSIPSLTEVSPYQFVQSESHLVEGAQDQEPVYDRLVYRWSDGRVQIDKVITVDTDHRYTTGIELVFRDLTGQGRTFDRAEVLMWADDSQTQRRGFFNPIANTREVACYVENSVEHKDKGDIEGQQYTAPAQWAGVQDRYFLSAVAVPQGAEAAGCRFEREGNHIAGVLILNGFTLEPLGEHRFELLAYTGPKDMSSLQAVGANLPRSVNFGIFGFLARPMKWVLTAFYKVIPNWGVAIILLTLLVKLLMFPWTQKSFKSMERMKAIQPKMAELKEKYANDKTKLTEETMKLYREHNVSPFGCLPMLLQMPIYIALYRMIYSSVELYKAGFALWINDLSEPDPTYVLPVLMAVTMLGQQLLTPTTTDNPQMKWMMRLMPIIFGVFMLVLPSGLVLYIFVSSLLGIGQQYLIRRQFRKPEAAVASAVASGTETRQQRRQRERREKKR